MTCREIALAVAAHIKGCCEPGCNEKICHLEGILSSARNWEISSHSELIDYLERTPFQPPAAPPPLA